MVFILGKQIWFNFLNQCLLPYQQPKEGKPYDHLCREPARESPPMTRSCGRVLVGKVSQNSRGAPLGLPEHLPQNQNLFYYFTTFTNSSDIQFSSVQSLSCVRLFVIPWIAACQASLSITNSQSPPKPCPSSRWCHPAISSSVVPFSSCPQSFPASGSFPMSQLFTSGG